MWNVACIRLCFYYETYAVSAVRRLPSPLGCRRRPLVHLNMTSSTGKALSSTSITSHFQNAIPIRRNTNVDRKSHHYFGQRMIDLANHNSPSSVDLPTEKKYLHRETTWSIPATTGSTPHVSTVFRHYDAKKKIRSVYLWYTAASDASPLKLQ